MPSANRLRVCDCTIGGTPSFSHTIRMTQCTDVPSCECAKAYACECTLVSAARLRHRHWAMTTFRRRPGKTAERETKVHGRAHRIYSPVVVVVRNAQGARLCAIHKRSCRHQEQDCLRHWLPLHLANGVGPYPAIGSLRGTTRLPKSFVMLKMEIEKWLHLMSGDSCLE